MADWIFDDFEGRSQSITNNVTAPTTANTYASDYPYGAGTMVFSTSAAQAGTYGLKINTASNARAMDYTFTDAATVWVVFYVKLANLPTASIHPIALFGSNNVTYGGDLRINTSGQITLRDGSYTATSTDSTGSYAMSTNTSYRIAMRVTATGTTGNNEAKIYVGDSSSPAWSDSDTTVTTNSLSTFDTVRFGVNQSASVVDFYVDNLHIGSTEWMPSTGAGNVDYDIVGNYTANTATLASWTLDCRTSTGTVTVSQTSGTTASKTESPTGLWTITNPSGTDDLVFHVEADDNGSVDTANFTLTRGAAGTTERPAIWVKTASGWS